MRDGFDTNILKPALILRRLWLDPFRVGLFQPDPDKKGRLKHWSPSGGETGIHFRLTGSSLGFQ
jgi:hypothetical protein